MSDALRVSQVFVPGRLPEYTYNPREHMGLEEQVHDYVDERGSIFTVAGPTKTGKSVLLEHVLDNPAWIDSQGIESVDVLWERLADKLRLWSSVGVSTENTTTGTGAVGSEVGFGPLVKVKAGAEYSAAEQRGRSFGFERPLASLVSEALIGGPRTVVIDDFHFIDRVTQREIVRALKPLVLKNVPIILVSISHRLRDVVSAEPDMGGRVRALDVDFWTVEDLEVIAQKGFQQLSVEDPGGKLAQRLAEESYGSPHLMQQFCRELCKANGVRNSVDGHEIRAPDDWREFFAGQLDESSKLWFERLLRGPQERGSKRTQWELKDGRTLDGYGLTLAAIAATGPKLELTKDEIKEKVDELVRGQGPAAHQTTRVLQHMSAIAATRAGETIPSEEELDEEHLEERLGLPDVQPVVEYIDEGPGSRFHIADPFFAFFVRWGSGEVLPTPQSDNPLDLT